jgi:tRNA threonylcarbamoyladenosine biosynthesis protein TsaE
MVKYFEHLSNSADETKRLGEFLARKIAGKKRRKALIFGLKGDLGGGKTTFLQGFAKGLGIKQKILSPTFLIMKRFELKNPAIKQFSNFYHFDCYRIIKSKEILNLGFKTIISDPKNIIAVELAERIKKIIPQNAIWISFEFVDQNKRKIKIEDKVLRL